MKFCLIDVANLIHRARRVQGKSTDTELMISMSLQTIFLSMSKVFNKLNAEHAVMCFDTYSWRKVIFEDYKAHRTEKVTRSEQRIRESINRICDDSCNRINSPLAG